MSKVIITCLLLLVCALVYEIHGLNGTIYNLRELVDSCASYRGEDGRYTAEPYVGVE